MNTNSLYQPDHLIVAAADLQSGVRYLENLLKAPLESGGQHLKMGTHNALLKIGNSLYLEVIAIDPTLPAPHRPRWFGLDDPEIKARLVKRPQLLHWVVRTKDIEKAAQVFPGPQGTIISMNRGSMSWKITVPTDGSLPGKGTYPSLIEWDTDQHPANTLPDRECALLELILGTAEPEAVGQELNAVGLKQNLTIKNSPRPTLSAWIKTPAGPRLLE